MSHIVRKKLCIAVSPWTGKQCKAKAVGPNTLKKGTREFLDDRFCQMHQPGVESKKKCVCPHCHYHRSRDRVPIIPGETQSQSGLSNGDFRDSINDGVGEVKSRFGKTNKKKRIVNNK